MSRYTHHTPEQCNRVKKLRQQGLSFQIISERMGFSPSQLRYMDSRARFTESRQK
nr:MAG TPA: transposase [Caudoviricetes sp.]